MAETTAPAGAFPREDLYRAVYPGVEVRDDDASGLGTLTGHFAVFDQWTEINSMFEGRFMERIAPGAFRKTLKEGRSRMKVLFNHGKDPQIGNKVLGSIDELREDDTGAAYSVPLFDTAYNRELAPGLRAGVYGASFRFSVMQEEIVEKPKRSKDNPEGLPERTIKEAKVMEFGPVTFPAYAGATAGVRSLTDEFHTAGTSGTIPNDSSNLEALESTEPDNESTPPDDSREALADETIPVKHRDPILPSRTEANQPGRKPHDYLNPTRKEAPSWRL